LARGRAGDRRTGDPRRHPGAARRRARPRADRRLRRARPVRGGRRAARVMRAIHRDDAGARPTAPRMPAQQSRPRIASRPLWLMLQVARARTTGLERYAMVTPATAIISRSFAPSPTTIAWSRSEEHTS